MRRGDPPSHSRKLTCLLRTAFRPLLFLDNSLLSSSSHTTDVPTLILLHHILSRSASVPLPHEKHGWSEAEYVRWLNEHGEAERLSVVEGVVRGWEEGKGKEEPQESEGWECAKSVREVLGRGKA